MAKLEVIKEAYSKFIENINKVYDVFKDYYGEDRVDLLDVISEESYINCNKSLLSPILPSNSRPYILVYFPEVTITNENDISTDIKKLWAKIIIDEEGRLMGSFSLNRSHYTLLHWNANYMHSHIQRIPKEDIKSFLSPCLGSGPIRDTIASLNHDYDESLWMLFCRELDVYTKVESLAGVPYMRISNIVSNANTSTYRSRYLYNFSTHISYSTNAGINKIIKEFTSHLIDSRILRFNYYNGSYGLAMDWFDYYIRVSNAFIEWFNQYYNEGNKNINYDTLISKGVIHKVEISGRDIFTLDKRSLPAAEAKGKKVLTFKGQDILLEIEGEETNTPHYSHLLNSSISTYILRLLITLINHKYGRETIESTGGPNSVQKVKYYF